MEQRYDSGDVVEIEHRSKVRYFGSSIMQGEIIWMMESWEKRDVFWMV